MIRRVYVNENGYIALDSDMMGARKRLSTGRKRTNKWEKYYEKNFEHEYEILYEEKFGKQKLSATTLGEYGYEVLEATRMRRNERTHKTNHRYLKDLVEWFGNVELNCITKMKCEQWQNAMLLEFSEKTVKNRRAILNLILEYAVDDEHVRRNPLKRLPGPKRPKDMGKTELQLKREPIYWKYDEVMKIIESTPGQDRNAYELVAFSGLRGGEMIGLRWDKVDFVNNLIYVDEQIVDGKVTSPKYESMRVVAMFPRARDALLRQRMKTGLSKYVFLTQYRTPYLKPDSFTRRLESLTATIGLRPGGLHDLRRFHNTLLKQLGYPVDFVLQQLGHKSEQVNRDHYTGQLSADPEEFEKRLNLFGT